MKGRTAMLIFACLAASNYLWLAISGAGSSFMRAGERSFFEGVAILACFVASRVEGSASLIDVRFNDGTESRGHFTREQS